jgi:single-stranded-DNA-specific exonuclease
VVLDSEGYPAGLVGLVAAKLVEELARPVLMLERGPETSRGSARSLPGFNILAALTTCDDLFVRYGGHSAAAGFTIATERLPELEARLLEYAEAHLPDEMLTPALEIDADVPLGALSWALLEQIAVLEPFGQSNPQPVLISRRVRVISSRATGAEGQHLKLRLDDGAGGPSYDAIAFRLGQLAPHFAKPRVIDIAYTLEANEWNGSRNLQLNIKDLRQPQA